jgi:hypothetical protein
LKNFNTIDSFKKLDKKQFLKEALQELVLSRDGAWSNPNLLFLPKFITFADLKKFHYYYWMCFPTFKLSKIFLVSESFISEDLVCIIQSVKDVAFAFKSDFKLISLEEVSKFSNLDDFTFCIKDHANPDTAPTGSMGVMSRNLIALIWDKFHVEGTSLKINLIGIRSVFENGQENLRKSKVFR